MTDEKRCEPPPELRGVDGWHWVRRDCRAPELLEWQHEGIWLRVPAAYAASRPSHAAYLGYRYLAPVTPPATVAALVGALEGLMRWHPAKDTISRMGLKPEPAEAAYEAARVALALYRGAGR